MHQTQWSAERPLPPPVSLTRGAMTTRWQAITDEVVAEAEGTPPPPAVI